MKLPLVISSYLAQCNITVSKSFLTNRLLTHPSYPSLLSIADTLDDLGIRYEAIDTRKTNLDELSYPLLAHTPRTSDEYTVVRSIADFRNPQTNIVNEWDGIALLVEPKQRVSNAAHNLHLQTEVAKKIAISAISAIFVSAGILTSLFHYHSLLTPLLWISFVATTLFWSMKYQVHTGAPFMNWLCSKAHGKTCYHVMVSPASKLMGIPMHDIGLIGYSSITSLILIGSFIGFPQSVLWAIRILVYISFTITLYTIFLQSHVMKTWCRMCIAATFFVWMQTFLVAQDTFINPASGTSSFQDPLLIVFIFTALLHAWLSLTFQHGKGEQALYARMPLDRWLRDTEVFKALAKLQKNGIPEVPGNPLQIEAHGRTIRIAIVIDPHCGPCEEAFRHARDMLSKHSHDISVSFILKVGTLDIDDEVAQANRAIVGAVLSRHDPLEVLNDWFNTKNQAKFIDKYKYHSDIPDETYRVLSGYYNWFQNVRPQFTPFVVINGTQLPKQYKVSDISNFIYEITEVLPTATQVSGDDFVRRQRGAVMDALSE